MADQGKSIVDLENEIKLLKDKNKILNEAQGTTSANNAKIKQNLQQIEAIEKRLLKLKTETREETEGQVDATEKLKNLSNDLTKLAAKEARLAKGKKGLLLEMRNISVKSSKIRDAVRKGENAAGQRYSADERNALKELEKARKERPAPDAASDIKPGGNVMPNEGDSKNKMSPISGKSKGK